MKIIRKQKQEEFEIYRKPTSADTTIHYTANKPTKH